jgi:hypothetical protein
MSHVLMRTMFCMRMNVISNLNQTVKRNVKSCAMIYCQMNCINGELGFGVNALLFVTKECRGGSFCAIIITDTLWKRVNAIRINDRMIRKLVICINAKEIGKQVTGRRYSFVRSLWLHSRLPLKWKMIYIFNSWKRDVLIIFPLFSLFFNEFTFFMSSFKPRKLIGYHQFSNKKYF